MMQGMSVRSGFSVKVADYIEKGYSCQEALHIVLAGICDGSGPRTTDVLLDLEDMGVWRPEPLETDEAPGRTM